jgi:hypothetical protein
MTRLVLRGLGAHKLRSALTSIAIILGVAMMSGTFVVSDQITNAFGTIFQTAFRGTDVFLEHRQVFTPQNGGGDQGPLPASLIAKVRAVPGVADAEGQIQAQGALVVNDKYVSSTRPNASAASTAPLTTATTAPKACTSRSNRFCDHPCRSLRLPDHDDQPPTPRASAATSPRRLAAYPALTTPRLRVTRAGRAAWRRVRKGSAHAHVSAIPARPGRWPLRSRPAWSVKEDEAPRGVLGAEVGRDLTDQRGAPRERRKVVATPEGSRISVRPRTLAGIADTARRRRRGSQSGARHPTHLRAVAAVSPLSRSADLTGRVSIAGTQVWAMSLDRPQPHLEHRSSPGA